MRLPWGVKHDAHAKTPEEACFLLEREKKAARARRHKWAKELYSRRARQPLRREKICKYLVILGSVGQFCLLYS